MSDLPYIEAASFGGPFRWLPNLVVFHSIESAIKAGLARSLAGPNFFGKSPSNGGPGTSVHELWDPSEGIQGVPNSHVAYHAGQYANPKGTGKEHTGRAAFTREEWMTPDGIAMLKPSARHSYQYCMARGIPWRWLSLAQVALAAANPGRPELGGLCTHLDITQALGGTSHTDPGRNFPYAEILVWGPGDGAAPSALFQEENVAHFIMPSPQVWPADKPRPVLMVIGRVAHWMRSGGTSSAELEVNQAKQIELGQTAEQVAVKSSNDIYKYFSATCGPVPPAPFRQDLPKVDG